MALYQYLKAEIINEEAFSTRRFKNRLIGLAFVLTGFFVATSQFWPIIKWQVQTLPAINAENLLSPQSISQQINLKTVSVKTDSDGFSYFFDHGSEPTFVNGSDSFLITIPKSKIDNALVLINSQEFTKNLAHFPGSSLPGKKGNVFITGHSALPQFFDPKDYSKIFSKLTDLKNGDVVDVTFNNRLYTYQVVRKKVVDPKDITVLIPPETDGKYLTLMTCVPPGLNSQRLIVTTKLIEDNTRLN